MTAGNVETVSANERAYRHIHDGIIRGRYQPDEMLSEAVIAAELKISRTPIRAALVRLQEEQWIAIYPKRGALVKGLTERAMSDLVEARLILEAASVQRADHVQLGRLARRLDGLVKQQAEAFAAQDIAQFIELTTAFHRSFVEVGGNEVLLELGDRLVDRQKYTLYRLGDLLLERCQSILDEHCALVRALEAGDAALFAQELRNHINDVHTERLAPFTPLA